MEAGGIIMPSNSPYSSPIVLACKKDNSFRFCADFRRLNSKTVPDAHLMADLRDTLYGIAGAVVFSSLDLQPGFWQIELEEESREKTAFQTPLGLYHFKIMPFGLRNSPASFQRLMNSVLRGYIGICCCYYENS